MCHCSLNGQNDLPSFVDIGGRKTHFLHTVGYLQQQKTQRWVRVPLGGHVEGMPDRGHEAHHTREKVGVNHL